MDARQQRGIEISKNTRSKIKNVADTLWTVPSQTHSGTYVVNLRDQSCTCPDHETRSIKCKHQWAVEYVLQLVPNEDGSTTVTQTLKISYKQDWPKYNAAQCNEKEQVQVLLRDLCKGIVTPPHKGRGRKPLPLADAVYGATMKVYTTFSGRRASTDIRECESKGFVDHAPCYNSIFNYLEKPDLTPLLTVLVEESASPLTAVETKFAVDSTGFGTSVYRRWFDHKYGREMKEHTWLKAHIITGVTTNVVTSVKVTEGNANDSPELPGLVTATERRFRIDEVSADKAYLSHRNLAAISEAGGVPYIPFKSNSQGEGSEAWKRLWHLYNYKRPEFLAHYHLRSNSESTFSAIKRKFGGSVRSKLFPAQVNEILCKVLCYNLSILVHSMYELGVEPQFSPVPITTSQDL